MNHTLLIFYYFLKNRLLQKENLFWTILYPIILISIFYFGFSGLMNQNFQKIPIATHTDYPYAVFVKEIQIFSLQELSEEEGQEQLRNEDIIAYIQKDGTILFLKSGTSQTLVKEIMDRFHQVEALVKSGVPFENLKFNISYIEILQQKEDFWKLTFYTCIAMISFYSVYGGIQVSIQDEVISRISISPLQKSKRILYLFFIAICINLLVNLLLLFYIDYILKLNLFPNLWESFSIISCGNIFGTALGILIGLPKKISLNNKIGIATGLLLLPSFLAGMMGRNIPRLISKSIPWFEKINPISIVCNNLMRINMLHNHHGYLQGNIFLLIQSSILLILGLYILKIRQYEEE